MLEPNEARLAGCWGTRDASRQRGADQSVVRVGQLQDGVEEESQDVHRDQKRGKVLLTVPER